MKNNEKENHKSFASSNARVYCAGGCGDFVVLRKSKITKCDFYLCGKKNLKCENVLLEKLKKVNWSCEMRKQACAAGSFLGVDFMKTEGAHIRYGICGEQTIFEEGATNTYVLLRRHIKPPLSKRSANEIYAFFCEVIAPQLSLNGYKDGAKGDEIERNIKDAFGSTKMEIVATIRGGDFDELDPQ